jgi:hypothetical protein
MNHPDIVPQLDGLHDAKRVPSVGQGDLEDARAKALHRLCDIGLPTLGRNRQSRQTSQLRFFRELAEVPSGRIYPAYGPCSYGHSPSPSMMLSKLTTPVKRFFAAHAANPRNDDACWRQAASY